MDAVLLVTLGGAVGQIASSLNRESVSEVLGGHATVEGAAAAYVNSILAVGLGPAIRQLGRGAGQKPYPGVVGDQGRPGKQGVARRDASALIVLRDTIRHQNGGRGRNAMTGILASDASFNTTATITSESVLLIAQRGAIRDVSRRVHHEPASAILGSNTAIHHGAGAGLDAGRGVPGGRAPFQRRIPTGADAGAAVGQGAQILGAALIHERCLEAVSAPVANRSVTDDEVALRVGADDSIG